MTEDSKIMKFGSHVGQVNKFFNRKGFGFIHDLNDNTDYFVYYKDIKCKEGLYMKLYPGEYVSYNLGRQDDGRDKCVDVRGIMGHLLLTENPDHNYRVYPKEENRTYGSGPMNSKHMNSVSDHMSSNHISGDVGVGGDVGEDVSKDVSNSDSDSDVKEEEVKEEEEIINKEAPEGIEVADFDGLNTNEEMS